MGTYRSWGEVQPVHFFVFAGLLMTTVFMFTAVKKKRAMTLAGLRKAIPHDRMPISRNDMSRKMYQEMVNELVREHRIKTSLVPASPGAGDTGWGHASSNADGPNLDGVHFKTSVAKSYLVLEEAASIPRPGTKHRDFRTIREFLVYLQTEFPSISDDLARDYIHQYERARFSQYAFSVDDYTRFMSTILELVERIN